MAQSTKDTSFISRLNKRKIAICCIVVFIYILVCSIPFFVLGFGHGALERAYYLSQILSGFFVIAGVAVALIQYLSNNEELKAERIRQSIVKAAELADEYCNEIIPYSNKLAVLYSGEKMNRLLDQIKQEDLTMFNQEEIKNKFNENIILVWTAGMVNEYAKINNLDMHKKESYTTALNEMGKFMAEFANRLESLCIKLNTGIADEATVYQSLHSNFILNVQMLYFPLSYDNTSESERLYSNVRDMYRTWNKMSKEMQKREEESAAEFQAEQRKKKEEFNEQFIRRKRIKKK